MEEELLRRQALTETVLHEAASLSTVIELLVVGERAIRETEGNTTTLNVLLTNARHHLRNVNRATLRACLQHADEAILLRQSTLTQLT